MVLTIISCLFFYKCLTVNTIRFFVTISVLLREILMLVLPFLIFSSIATALSEFKRNEIPLILLLIPVIFISSFFHAFLSGILGFTLLSEVKTQEIVTGTEITPFFQLGLSNVTSMLIALVFGIVIGGYNLFYKNKYVGLAIYGIRNLVMHFMRDLFLPLLPVFIGGFFLKLFCESKIDGFIRINIFIFLRILLILVMYYAFWLCVSANFNIKKILEISKNICPAILTAFVTISSAIALPLTLIASEKNTKNKKLVNAITPLTLSFHLIGDTLIVPIMCMIILLVFNHELPTSYNFILFSMLFIINQFAGAGVPNATIMVLIPALNKYWGYSDTMVAFAIAFYAIVEPISTIGNVMANNIFIILFNKIKSSSIFESEQ
ncbi:MAG: dicarboxylate/amino acid:cation symporter [Coxiellaceae bacterium]|nr:dicarboxylate/amino acid:cation symporter [Coxiellaceae bacterium]